MYQLNLTEADINDIAFVGGRYCWSHALRHLQPGTNDITEAEAWEICDAFELDTCGSHHFFPMLDSDSG